MRKLRKGKEYPHAMDVVSAEPGDNMTMWESADGRWHVVWVAEDVVYEDGTRGEEWEDQPVLFYRANPSRWDWERVDTSNVPDTVREAYDRVPVEG